MPSINLRRPKKTVSSYTFSNLIGYNNSMGKLQNTMNLVSSANIESTAPCDIYEGEILGFYNPQTSTDYHDRKNLISSYFNSFLKEIPKHKINKNLSHIINITFHSATTLFPNISLSTTLRIFKSLQRSYLPLDEIIDEYGLSSYKNNSFDSLNIIQKRISVIISVMITGAKLIWLDHPTSSLDEHSKKQMWDIIHTLKQKGITIIITTDDELEAEVLSDRVALVHKGKIIKIDNPVSLIYDKNHTNSKRELSTLQDVYNLLIE